MEKENTKRESPLSQLKNWFKERQSEKKAQRFADALMAMDQETRVAFVKTSMNKWREKEGIPDNTIEAYREKFKVAPLGHWTTSLDSGPWPTDTWEFYADGTGKIFQESAFGDNEMLFEWQPKAERTIKFRILEEEDAENENEATTVSHDEPETLKADPTDPPQEYWRTLVYDFKLIDYYVPTPVLFEVPENETFKFGMTTDYLFFGRDIQS
jgi:hypothetical protein